MALMARNTPPLSSWRCPNKREGPTECVLAPHLYSFYYKRLHPPHIVGFAGRLGLQGIRSRIAQDAMAYSLILLRDP